MYANDEGDPRGANIVRGATIVETRFSGPPDRGGAPALEADGGAPRRPSWPQRAAVLGPRLSRGGGRPRPVQRLRCPAHGSSHRVPDRGRPHAPRPGAFHGGSHRPPPRAAQADPPRPDPRARAASAGPGVPGGRRARPLAARSRRAAPPPGEGHCRHRPLRSRRGRVMKRRVLLALVAVSAAGGCARAATAQRTGGAAAVPVTVAEARLTSVADRLDAVASVEAYETVSLKAQAGGQIGGVRFAEGRDGPPGDLLFQTEPRPSPA